MINAAANAFIVFDSDSRQRLQEKSLLGRIAQIMRFDFDLLH